MNQMVSKERTRKTKKRQKQSDRQNSPQVAFLDRPFVGLLVAALVWLVAVFGWRAKMLIQIKPSLDLFLPLVGDAVFALVGLFCAALFLSIVRPSLLKRNSRIVLMGLTALLATGLAALINYASTNLSLIPPHVARFFLPFTLAPLLSTILIGGRAGIAVGGWTSLVIALYWEHSLAVFVTGMVASTVVAHSARQMRTRTKVAKLGLVAGLAQIICVLGVTSLEWNSPNIMPVVHEAAASLAGGLLCAVIALLILPIFEHVFSITTDITLLEFSDLGHPLLQRLALEAPGTYHHSLVVANLAQAAAEAIEANGLEARVCAYFHDIGKLTKPNFFIENLQMQQNPHDDLPPSMSTLIIMAHVKEGLSLALLHKLPEPVKRAIREHHGSSMLAYFHQKAKSQLEFEMEATDGTSSQKVEDSSFRYQGPLPSTKESAIICLADAVEAASRSIEKNTPGHIEGLVDDIVRMRLDDGQLSHCNLTLKDLATVQRSFVFSLATMLHGRVPYPKDENKDKQQPKAASRERAANQGSDTVADEEVAAAK